MLTTKPLKYGSFYISNSSHEIKRAAHSEILKNILEANMKSNDRTFDKTFAMIENAIENATERPSTAYYIRA